MYRKKFTPMCILTKWQHNREKEILRANQRKTFYIKTNILMAIKI